MPRLKDNFNTSKIHLSLPSSTGTWLNGCQRPQHKFVQISIQTGERRQIVEVGMSLEQFTHMLTSSSDTDCTLLRYVDEGPVKHDEVERPKSIKARMNDRLGEVRTTMNDRLKDLYKDVHEMVNGKKPGKKDLERLLHEIRILGDNYSSNEGFVVQQASEEVDEMLDNARSQMAQVLPITVPLEDVHRLVSHLIPDQNEGIPHRLISAPIAPVIEPYTPKERSLKAVVDMTAMELGEELHKELNRLESIEPPPAADKDGMRLGSLHHAHAWSTMPNRVRIQYISYQSDSLLDMDEAQRYLEFLRGVKEFKDFRRHFNFLQNRE